MRAGWRGGERAEELFISCRSGSLGSPLLSQMSHSPSSGVSLRRVGRVILLPLAAFHVLNPHSCSPCVTSSHSPAFFNRLSLSIKPPPSSSSLPSSSPSPGSNQMSQSAAELNPNVSRTLSQTHESRAEMTCWSQLKGEVSSPLMCAITDVPSYLRAV